MNPRRKRLLQSQGNCCHYCSTPIALHNAGPNSQNRPTYDHKHPAAERAKGASNEGVIACRACNGAKNDLPYDVFVAIMAAAENPDAGRRAAVKARSRRDKLQATMRDGAARSAQMAHNHQVGVSNPSPAPNSSEDDHATA